MNFTIEPEKLNLQDAAGMQLVEVIRELADDSGTTDYEDLENLPKINSVELKGNKTTGDLNISYNDLDDLPKINGVELTGNKSTTELDIQIDPSDIASAVDDWCDTNIAQEAGYVLDSSLTMSNAAAPADKVGELKSKVTALDSEVFTDIECIDASVKGGTNTAVTSNGDGTYTVGTDDYGNNWFGSPVTLTAGKYLLFGSEYGFTWVNTTATHNNPVASNDTGSTKEITIPNDGSYYVGLRIPSAPAESFTIRPSLVKTVGLQFRQDSIDIGISAFRFKPCYDHLFVGRTGANCTIPHESLYHVRLSKMLGFDIIEGNLHPTSDGVFVVNHLNDNTFADYFHHADGETDISNVKITDVTWAWVVENVRYNSIYPKYQTRPCRLEEFLSECRQQNIIPVLTATNPEAIKIADKIMGVNNYIAYGASRNTCPNAIIYSWETKTTKQEIIDVCNSYGRPFIYGMGNPNNFTDEELKDIVETLHSNGFWISTAYNDADWYKLSNIGFDLNGSTRTVNRMKNGNICNFDSINGFSDYTVTNGTESQGTLVFSQAGNITPKIDNNTVSLGVVGVEMWFNGTVGINAIGEQLTNVYFTSDGSFPVFFETPVINGSLKMSINPQEGTTVYDLFFKASKF